MPETTTTVTNSDPIYNIERNGVSIPFYPVPRKRDAKDKDGNLVGAKGELYPSVLPKTDEDWNQLFIWLGPWLRPKLQGILNQYFLNLWTECTNEDGVTDSELFQKQVAEMSARGEKIGDIVNRIVQLRFAITEAIEADDYELVKQLTAEFKMLGDAYARKKKTKQDEEEAKAAGLAAKDVPVA